MALPESALSELLDVFRTGDGVDLIRDAVRLVFQELIETEATAVIGAEPYERTATRANERNGHRDRVLSTKAGDVELRIPEAAARIILPVHLGTPPPDRSGLVRGRHDRLRARRVDPLRR